jgi:hypothetical protein
MKSALIWLALLAVVTTGWCQTPAAGSAQTAPKKKVSPLADYAGEWTATFNGKVWLRLQLELRGEQIIGALLHARKIDVNDSGDIKSVSDEESGGTIAEAVLNPDGLVLTVKDVESKGTDHYMMRLVLPTKETAELKMIGEVMPPGMPKPKPWRLVKSGTGPTTR